MFVSQEEPQGSFCNEQANPVGARPFWNSMYAGVHSAIDEGHLSEVTQLWSN